MKLYNVIPIGRTMGKETLSYFGRDSIELGSLVSIPLRKKTGLAIVVDKKDVREVKSEIRNSEYSLKKINKVESKNFLSKEFLEATRETSKWYAASTGAILENVTPKHVLDNASKIHPLKTSRKESEPHEPLVMQAEDEERFAHYKSFIRGQFAKQASVYFCLPNIEDVRQAQSSLEKGIEQYTIAVHSGLTKKEFLEVIQIIENERHPILIIGTAPYLSIERNDLGSIVLDRENSRSYRTKKRPFIDLRNFVKFLAKSKKIPLLLGDTLLSVETMWHQKNDSYVEFSPLKMRILSPARDIIVDMKNKDEESKKFRVLSPELMALIDKTKEENENLFIFSVRKGLAPSTVCGDCGQLVTCTRCNAPVSLYSGKNKENFFLCNKCGLKSGASIRCSNCDSWKLNTLGIGIELVEEEIRKKFPDITIFRLDKEIIKTEKKARDIITKFENSPGSILLGTELALFYLKKQIENVAVASIDSLFSVPDFRINEKIFYNLLLMRSLAQKVFLIQTRNKTEPVFEYATKGNLADFYKNEITDREDFDYPPFKIFIKISTEGKSGIVEKVGENIKEFLKEYGPSLYQAFSPSKRGNAIVHLLIRRDPKEWPDDGLITKLRELGPAVSIKVDPESLL